MSQKLELIKVLNEDTAIEIREHCSNLDNARWIHRSELKFPRAVGNSSCRYDFCGDSQMPNNLKDMLVAIAPKFDEFFLSEVGINRYQVGDFIGKHRDKDLYRMNVVVSLQENGDGLMIDDEHRFIEDRLGQGICIKGVGPVHSVPPVNQIRYTLIYLYE